LNTKLSDLGSYGVPKGEKVYKETGLFVTVNYNNVITPNITYKGRADFFSNYYDKPENINLYMTNTFTFQINKHFSANYSLDLIYDDKIANINQEIAYLKNKGTDVKQERLRMRRELKNRCNGLKAAEKTACIRNMEHDINYIDRRFEDELIDYTNNINKLTTYGKDLKKDIQMKTKLAKEDVSQQAVIETKCVKNAKKKKRD
jgi:hypothetical protein